MRLQCYLNTKTKTKREHGRPHGTHASDGAPSVEPAYLDTYYLRFYSSQSIQRHRAHGRPAHSPHVCGDREAVAIAHGRASMGRAAKKSAPARPLHWIGHCSGAP